jgi:hypothetical protein
LPASQSIEEAPLLALGQWQIKLCQLDGLLVVFDEVFPGMLGPLHHCGSTSSAIRQQRY